MRFDLGMRCLQRPLLLDAAFLSKGLPEARGNFCWLFVWTLDSWEGQGRWGRRSVLTTRGITNDALKV